MYIHGNISIQLLVIIFGRIRFPRSQRVNFNIN